LVDNSGYQKRPSKLTTGFPLASPAARRLQRRFDAGEASGAKGQYRLTMQTDLTAVVVALLPTTKRWNRATMIMALLVTGETTAGYE